MPQGGSEIRSNVLDGLKSVGEGTPESTSWVFRDGQRKESRRDAEAKETKSGSDFKVYQVRQQVPKCS